MENISQAKEEGNTGTGVPCQGTGKEIEYYSNSSITTFQQCPKKFFWSYHALLTTKKKSAPLGFGTALHTGIRNLYRGKEADNVELVKSYIPKQGEELRTQAKLHAVFEEYKKAKMPPVWEVLAVEEPIQFEIYGKTFVVIPDMVVKWRDQIYVVEHKHSTRLTDNFFRKFQRDSQIDMEMLGVIEKYGSCAGVYINAIIIRKGGPKSKLAEVEILMDLITRTKEQLEEAKSYFVQWASKITFETEFLENRRSCFDYNDSCSFLGLCTGVTKVDSELYEKRERSLNLVFKQEEEE